MDIIYIFFNFQMTLYSYQALASISITPRARRVAAPNIPSTYIKEEPNSVFLATPSKRFVTVDPGWLL